MSKKKSTWDRIRAAFKSKDEAALEEALEDAETADSDGDDDDEKDKDGDKSTKTSDSATLAAIQKTLDSMNKRFTDMESELKEIKEKKDDDGKTGDTVLEAEEAERNTEAKGETYTGDMASVRQRAEILAPGFKLPTFDSKAKAADAICSCQRRALDAAYATDGGRAAITPFLAGRAPEFETMDSGTVNTIFTGAAELMRHTNNARGMRSGINTRDFGRQTTVADVNQRNRQFWAGRSGQ